MTTAYPRIVFLDLEGTLLMKDYALDNGKVAPSAWTLLAQCLGPDCLAEEEETKDRWNRNEYAGYVEWMRDTIRIHQKYGLTKRIFDEVVRSVDIVPGAFDAISDFKRQGAITAIISGGFKALGDRVQRALKIDHALCGCEYFFSEQDGSIEHFNLLPADVEGKVHFMQLIAKEHGINPVECAFVGDGMNDVHLAREVGISVAFNAQRELRAASTLVIDQRKGAEDFREVARKIADLRSN